jgi:hypothetical protein
MAVAVSRYIRLSGALWRWSTVIVMPAQKRLVCVCGERRAEVLLWPGPGRDDLVADADVSWRTTAKAMPASSTRPRARSDLTLRSAAHPCRASISAVLPMPADPSMAARAPAPAAASPSSAASRASSTSRSRRRPGSATTAPLADRH